jgi:DNA-binding CsgD family transcriptional regulator
MPTPPVSEAIRGTWQQAEAEVEAVYKFTDNDRLAIKIGGFTPHQITVFLLRVRGMSLGKIAARAGVTKNAVVEHLRAAERKAEQIRKHLKDFPGLHKPPKPRVDDEGQSDVLDAIMREPPGGLYLTTERGSKRSVAVAHVEAMDAIATGDGIVEDLSKKQQARIGDETYREQSDRDLAKWREKHKAT